MSRRLDSSTSLVARRFLSLSPSERALSLVTVTVLISSFFPVISDKSSLFSCSQSFNRFLNCNISALALLFFCCCDCNLFSIYFNWCFILSKSCLDSLTSPSNRILRSTILMFSSSRLRFAWSNTIFSWVSLVISFWVCSLLSSPRPQVSLWRKDSVFNAEHLLRNSSFSLLRWDIFCSDSRIIASNFELEASNDSRIWRASSAPYTSVDESLSRQQSADSWSSKVITFSSIWSVWHAATQVSLKCTSSSFFLLESLGWQDFVDLNKCKMSELMIDFTMSFVRTIFPYSSAAPKLSNVWTSLDIVLFNNWFSSFAISSAFFVKQISCWLSFSRSLLKLNWCNDFARVSSNSSWRRFISTAKSLSILCNDESRTLISPISLRKASLSISTVLKRFWFTFSISLTRSASSVDFVTSLFIRTFSSISLLQRLSASSNLARTSSSFASATTPRWTRFSSVLSDEIVSSCNLLAASDSTADLVASIPINLLTSTCPASHDNLYRSLSRCISSICNFSLSFSPTARSSSSPRSTWRAATSSRYR